MSDRRNLEGTRSANEIRQEIADFVITHADKMSDVSGVKEFVAEYGRRSKEIIEAKKRLKRLAKAKEKYEPLEKRVDACRKTLKDAETEFTKLYHPLGRTAFQAFIGGSLEELVIFSERLAVFKRVQKLQQECDGLAPDPVAGFARKAKAKAKQLSIKGTIKIEKMKFGKLEAKIGCQLVEAESEETVRCDLTSELLEQIANHRESLTDCKLSLQYAKPALTKVRDQLIEAVPLQTIESSKTFDTEIKICKKTIRESESSLAKSTRLLTDALAETDPTNLPDSLVLRLCEVKSSKNGMAKRMRLARKGISRYSSKTAVSVRHWWSGLSQQGKVITTVLVVICLLTSWFALPKPWNKADETASSQIAESLRSISSETLGDESIEQPGDAKNPAPKQFTRAKQFKASPPVGVDPRIKLLLGEQSSAFKKYGYVDPIIILLLGKQSFYYKKHEYNDITFGSSYENLVKNNNMRWENQDNPCEFFDAHLLGWASKIGEAREYIFDSDKRLISLTQSYLSKPNEYVDAVVEMFGKTN